MKLPGWIPAAVTSTSTGSDGSVTVVLDVDVSEYVTAMEDAAEDLRRLRWRMLLVDERRQARRWLDGLLDDMWAAYGWDRPLLPSRVRVGRTRWTLVKPADLAAPTVAELEAAGTAAGMDLTCFIEGDPA